jgi:Fe-S cluster assembly protein SufD
MENAMNMTAINVPGSGEPDERDAAAQLVGQYAKVAGSLPGHQMQAIRELRESAIAAFKAQGLPHRRVEEWKYTDLRRFMRTAFPPLAQPAKIAAGDIEAALGEVANINAVRVVFIDGHYNRALSSPDGLPRGVEMLTLGEALKSAPDWVLAALGQVNAQEGETVGLINTAFMTDGVAMRIAQGVVLDRPVHLIHVASAKEAASSAIRNVLMMDEAADAQFIESYVTLGGTGVQTHAVTEIALGEGARLRHIKLSLENTATQHLASANVVLAAKADYLGVNFASGGALSRHQSFIRFDGDGGKAHFRGAQLLRGDQHCDMTLVVDHAAVGCESREHVKSVLDDRAQGIFQAKVVVRPGAQQTDGRQMAQALLLSETAEFDAKPELEIYADDVKCNHGATSGALDEDLMFYLRARGISEDEARALLILAFVGEVLDGIEPEPLREALVAKASGWLATKG